MYLTLAHTNLDVYKISKIFILLCYKATKYFPPDERYALTQQIRRAALSVHLNIAEGSSRKSPVERKRYYEIARGSVIEIDTALDIAVALGYTDSNNLDELGKNLSRCFQMLSKMIEK
jgi:four helix bundle protein